MESAEEPRVRLRHVILTVVEGVKAGTAPTNEDREWVHFTGSRESLLFPKGTFAPGDRVKISFERIEPDAKPV